MFRGSYAIAKLCYDTSLDIYVAMKIMNKARLKKLFIGKNKTVYKLVETEIAIMKKMFHPNVVHLYEIIDDPNSNKLYLIMEYISSGTLAEKIKIAGKLPLEQCWSYFRGLIQGLEYCHKVAGIIHRDIKPENLLIGEDGAIHIADFGVSFMIENGSDEARATFGSAQYMAPEICKGRNYKGKQTDIWAAGITLYYMAVGELPFDAKNRETLSKLIISSEYLLLI
jgi:[calcium/calmodulin-dependent protein kinase] kinase